MSKFDKLASDNEILQSKIIMGEKTTKTLQENLNSNKDYRTRKINSQTGTILSQIMF